MSAIQAQIDELQKQLVIQQIAEREKKQKKTIVEGSIEQLEEFCNLSDKILDKPPPGAEARAAEKERYEKRREREPYLPPFRTSPGETLKEVFHNRLDPTHKLYESYHPARAATNSGSPFATRGVVDPDLKHFDDWFKFKGRNHPINRRGSMLTPAELEVIKNEWSRELENRVYSTTSAGDMYMNQTLKCILAIVKKQQQEIDWLKSKLDICFLKKLK